MYVWKENGEEFLKGFTIKLKIKLNHGIFHSVKESLCSVGSPAAHWPTEFYRNSTSLEKFLYIFTYLKLTQIWRILFTSMNEVFTQLNHCFQPSEGKEQSKYDKCKLRKEILLFIQH